MRLRWTSRLAALSGLGLTAGLWGTAEAGATASDETARGNVTVTVPQVDYEARDDRFRVGPYRSRLHVLFNDVGAPRSDSLGLVDRQGRVVPVLAIPRMGRLRVANGYVVFDPVPGARGAASFSYQASSPNGGMRSARAEVDVFPRVIVTRDDVATTAPRTPLSLAIAANDRIVVPGAALACPPELFARRPPPADPLPVVLPEPERPPATCEPPGRLARPEGEWLVEISGEVTFRPAADFTGTARAYYRQASEHPFDLGVARMTVNVESPDDTDVRGVQVVRQPPTQHTSRGDLALTGRSVLAALLVGASLIGTGLGLVLTARRRRQEPARDA